MAPIGLGQLLAPGAMGPAQAANGSCRSSWPIAYSGLLAAALANVIVFNGRPAAGSDPGHHPAVARAGDGGRAGVLLPARTDPAGPGRRRGDHRRGRGADPVRVAAAVRRRRWQTDRAGPGEPGETTDVAPPIPPLRDGEPPLAILIDYDGTVSLTDVTDMVMAEHVPGVWEEAAAMYDAGGMGSRRLMAWEMDLVEADPAALLATAAAQPHDPGFVPFIRRAQAAGHPDRGRVGRVRLLHPAGACRRSGWGS